MKRLSLYNISFYKCICIQNIKGFHSFSAYTYVYTKQGPLIF